MLSTPEYGWTSFSLRHLNFSVSNVFSPLPQGWLRETIRGLENRQPFVVWGWCEPEYIYCTVTKNSCYLSFTNIYDPHQGFNFAEYCTMTFRGTLMLGEIGITIPPPMRKQVKRKFPKRN